MPFALCSFPMAGEIYLGHDTESQAAFRLLPLAARNLP